MPYKKDDVGPKMVNGVAVVLTAAKRTVIAEAWNRNEKVTKAKFEAANARDGRLQALKVRIANGSADIDEIREYTILRDGLKVE